MSSGMIPAQPEKILRALGQVWTSLGKEERQQGQPTVLRACAMTLIIITDEEDEDSISATQTLVELMQAHPSRAIVLRGDSSAENGLAARVFAQCWKPFGKAQQICCEQIEVSASPERWLEVGPTILGIIVPDLPVVVWCRLKSAFRPKGKISNAGLGNLLELATKSIVDTRGAKFEDALVVLADWMTSGRLIADLEWTRLTRWRETIATVFEEESAASVRSRVDNVEIGYDGDTLPASALYMGGWLGRAIKARPSFHREKGLEPGLTRVSMKAPDLEITLSRVASTCLRVKIGEQEHQVSLGSGSLYELMHEELTVLGSDPVFSDVFVRAGGLLRDAA
jgi:glucose-6-phosphate dehydrogenase assembly protein OpcA